ncbi:hypothetical protein DYB37_000167 [Aphanomyces astaci]|uniref:CAP N-terminal domain-containing protein n=1 Tax=Aphanomyces astaci TaxID=112090 RepID=A0A418E1Y2_APHAT|nr:hypothetical protein DYB37_000167 [Aphanomyces astaci]
MLLERRTLAGNGVQGDNSSGAFSADSIAASVVKLLQDGNALAKIPQVAITRQTTIQEFAVPRAIPTARSGKEAWDQWFSADPKVGLYCAPKDYTKEMIKVDRRKYSERLTLAVAFSKYQNFSQFETEYAGHASTYSGLLQELSYPPQPPPSLQPHDNSLSPDSSSQQIQPLLDDAVHRLNARVAQLEAQFGLPSNHTSSSHAPPPLTSLPPPQASSAATSSSAPIAHGFVAYDVFSTAFLQPFLESCDKLGPDVAKYGAIVRRAFDAQRNYLLAASLSQKPTTGPVKGLLAPIQDAIREMHDLCDLRSDFANHQHMLYEGLQTLEWLHVDGAAPHAFMARYMGDVWGTKIRAQYKASNADQVRFAASFKALVTELMAYVEDFHPSGVTWNPDGGDVKDFLKPPSKRTKAKITLIRTLLGREPVKRNLNYSRQGTDEHDNLTKALAEWRADGEPVDKLSYRKKYGVPKLIWNTRTNANVNRRVSIYASPGITAVRMEQEEALVAKLKAQCHDNNIRWTAKDVQQYAVRDMGVSQISVRQWYSQHFLKRWPEAKDFIMRYKEAHGRETLTSTML